MNKKIKSLMFKISIISLLMIMSFAFVETASAYSYGTNLLTTNYLYNDWTHTLSYSQTIKLSPEDIVRANNGDLYYDANVHIEGHGSRTNTVNLGVSCWGTGGKDLYSFMPGLYDIAGESDETYWVAHAKYTFNISKRRIPAGTTEIRYTTSNTLSGWGGEGDIEFSEMYLKLYDDVKPFYSSVSSATAPGTYPAGTTMRYGVNFNEAIGTIADTGTFSTNLGTATYVGKSANRQTLYYDYTIPTSGTVSNYNAVKMTSISNLIVKDDAGNQSDVVTKNLTDNYGIYMDNKYPSVSSFVTEASANSYFVEGEKINFNATFDENIKVSGTPYISLSNGKTATYKAGTTSDTNLATFVYTVGSSDTNTNNLQITGINFNGIVDKVNQSATSSTSYSTNKYNDFLNSYSLGVDTNAPTVSFTDPTASWHKSDYIVKITPTDNFSGIKELYSVWTTSPSNTAPTFPSYSNVSSNNEIANPLSSGQYYLWIKAVDNAGNISSTKSSYTYKLDLKPPTITITPSYIGGYSAISKVEVIATDDGSGIAIKNYVWKDSNGVTVAQGNLNEEITYPDSDEIYSLTVTATDNVGNTTTKVEENITIDKTGPVVTFTPNGNSTYAKSSLVSISLLDAKTGILSYEYVWSDSVEIPTSGWVTTNLLSFTTPSGKSGTYYLHIKALDNAGNEAIKVSEGFNIDNVPPTVGITPNGNSDNIGQSEYEIGIIVQDSITATSYLDISYVFSTSESSTGLEFLPLETETVNLSDFSETTYLYVNAVDEAGNITLFKSLAFIADTTAPTGSIINTTGERINKASVNLNFTAMDDYTLQNDMMMQLSIDGVGEEWEFFSSSKIANFDLIEGTHTITVKFKDKCGNVSNPYNTSFIYDITPPEINIAYEPNTATNGNVIATATSPDMIEGDSTHTFNENGSFTFKAYDEAGNTSEKNAVVTWIDKTTPTINFSSDQFDNKNHQSATITINCSDNANGISNIMYRIVKDGQEAGTWESGINGQTISISGVTDGKYYIEAKAKDGVGNEVTKSSGYVYIDVTKPIATINYLPKTRTAQNVEAVITFNEVVTITNNEGNNTYIFKNNGDFTFEFEDEAGNKETAIAEVTWIDREKPEARIAITDESFKVVSLDKWVNYDLFVTIIPPAQSTIDNLTYNGELVSEITTGSSISSDIKDCGNNQYLISKYGELKFKVHDTDTFLESEGSITVRIDKNAPEFKSEMRTTDSWTNEDVIVTITASDDLSTVTYTNGNSYKFTENGSHTFNFIDSAGNKNSYTANVTNIDKDVPIANISYTVDGNPYNDEYINKDIKAKVDFDSLSPVTITNNGEKDEYTFTSNGEFTFEYIDDAGNVGSKKIVIDKIDKKAPTAYVTYNKTTWTNNDVIATLHVSDDWSGAVNDGEVHTFVVNGEHVFIARDNAGNNTITTASAIRIDKTPPTLSYSLSPSGKTPFSVFATVGSDKSVTWLNNGGRPSMQFISNGSFTFIARDYAGNESEINVEVNNITRESTPVTLEYSKTKPTNDDVYATIYPQDKENDIIFVVNNSNSKIYKFGENGEFTFNYRNPAGISGEAVASVSNINKTPPVIEVLYSINNLTNEDVIATFTADKDVIYPFAALNGKYKFTKNDKVQIPVTDMVGNKTYVLLDVNWIDKDAPKIELDNQYEAIGKGSVFNANDGVFVTDDNNIPNGIEITGTVDTSNLGDYEILYSATDAAGNTSEITKYVTVYDPDAFNIIINGRMPVNSEVEISMNNMTIETINQMGDLKLLCSAGKKDFGYFKKNGYEISKQHKFEQKGYYTIYLQDENRNTKLVYVFVK